MGATGETGPTGATGPIGPPGPTGSVGLQGSPGINGAVGAAGSIGPQGPAGAVGPAGPSGSQGVAGPGPLSGTATVTITEPAGRLEHQETLSADGVAVGHRLFVGLAPCSDADENDPELIDMLSLSALAGANSIAVTAAFGAAISGPIKLNWSAF